MSSELLYVALCLLGSGFFSASETALSSLPITRLEAMRQRGGRLTRAGLDRWAEAPQELLITILVGNNLVNVLASALATRIAYKLSDDGGLAFVVGIMTLVILVFGEITPKTLAQRHAQTISALVAPVLYVLDVVLRPVNKVLGVMTRLLSRHSKSEAPVTEEDLFFMLRLAHRHAQLPRDARLMIEAVLRLQRAVAHEVMVPRPRVVTVDAAWDAAELKTAISEAGHSRFPVVRGSPDKIVGILHIKNVQWLEDGSPWENAVVPPIFIPESKPLPDLLHKMRKEGQHLAIVLDEYGGFAGVVTLEDAVELVVGDIEDEFDLERVREVIHQGDDWVVPGHLTLRRMERTLHREIQQPEGADSVGGLLSMMVDHELVVGTTVEWDDLIFEILDVGEGRPTRVRVTPIS